MALLLLLALIGSAHAVCIERPEPPRFSQHHEAGFLLEIDRETRMFRVYDRADVFEPSWAFRLDEVRWRGFTVHPSGEAVFEIRDHVPSRSDPAVLVHRRDGSMTTYSLDDLELHGDVRPPPDPRALGGCQCGEPDPVPGSTRWAESARVEDGVLVLVDRRGAQRRVSVGSGA